MMTKNKILLFLILTLAMLTGCYLKIDNQGSTRQVQDNYFLSIEDVSNIYFENEELINRIKDGLFSSNFIPHDGMVDGRFNSNYENSIFLRFDYTNDQLFCCDDSQCERLKSIENVHSDAIEYFLLVIQDFNPSIVFRKIRNIGTIIEFNFFDINTGIHTGILYTTNPDKLSTNIPLGDNWYVYRHGLG